MANVEPPPLEYATPGRRRRQRREPSEALYRATIRAWQLSLVATSLLCLLVWMTRDASHVARAVLAAPVLLVAGALTIASMACGLTYARRAELAGYPPPHARRRASIAEMLPFSNVPLAVLLLIGGVAIALASPLGTVRLTLTNPGDAAIDDVAVVFRDGSRQRLGSIAARTAVTRSVAIRTGGSVDVDVTRNGQTWRQHVDDFVDADDLAGTAERSITLDPRTNTATP